MFISIHNPATTAATTSMYMTVAEYLERHDPHTAMTLPHSELTEWTRELRGWLDATEANYGESPSRREDGVRVYSRHMLGWAMDMWWHSPERGFGAPGGGFGLAGVTTSTKWLTSHTAAPVAATTVEERVAVSDPLYRWKPLDQDYVV